MATEGIEVDSRCNNCNEIMTYPKSCSEANSKMECPICKRSTENDKTSVIDSPRITHQDLGNIEMFLNNKVKSVNVKHMFVRFVNYNNNLWAACFKQNCLDVYSYDLAFIKSVLCPGIKRPNTLHPLTSKLMLVGGFNGLFSIDTDSGQVKDHILQGDIQDVHVNQGLIAVAVLDDIRYIQVLQQSPPYITVFRKKHPGALTVLVKPDKNIFLSDCDSFIFRYYTEGYRSTQYGTYGSSKPEESNVPRLCLGDTRGNILVADYFNQRLKVLTNDGAWIVPQQQGNMFHGPFDIIMTDTHLYVKDRNTINMFSPPAESK